MRIVIFFALLGTSAFACPDFSGTFVGTFTPNDDRATETLTIQQTVCNRIDLTSTITHKNGYAPATSAVTWAISDVPIVNGWYWDKFDLVHLYHYKDATSETCDVRDVARLDGDHLYFRWRFECPDKTTPWYTDNIIGGVYHRQ